MPSLECCNNKIKPSKVIALLPQDGYESRTLIIGRCPNCKNVRVQLIEYDIINDKWVINRGKPKRAKNVEEWADRIEKSENSFIPTKKIKYGNRANMSFVYFINKISKQTNKDTQHLGYDWNGTLRYKYLVPSVSLKDTTPNC